MPSLMLVCRQAVEQDPNDFTSTVLVLTATQLHRTPKRRDFLCKLATAEGYASVFDLLLCKFYPEHAAACSAYYRRTGVKLNELLGADTIAKIDGRLRRALKTHELFPE